MCKQRIWNIGNFNCVIQTNYFKNERNLIEIIKFPCILNPLKIWNPLSKYYLRGVRWVGVDWYWAVVEIERNGEEARGEVGGYLTWEIVETNKGEVD